MSNAFWIALEIALLGALASLAPGQSHVEVSMFGSAPNDNNDDTQALRDACAALSDNQKLVFEPGQYDLFLEGPPDPFLLNGLKNIELCGQNATLMLHGFNPENPTPWKINQLFGFSNCQSVTVSNLTIEMARAPFSCGTVEAVSLAGNGLDAYIRFPPEFPVTAAMYIASIFRYHPDGRPWGQDCDYYFGDVESPIRPQPVIVQDLAAPDVLRITLPSGVILSSGDKVALRHRNYGCNAFTAWDCTPAPNAANGLTIYNVTIHTIPGMGCYASGTHGVQIQTLRVIRTPGSQRLMSTTSDATHFQLCTGTIAFLAPTISNPPTALEGMGDDGTNIQGNYSRVAQIVATSGGGLASIVPAGQFQPRVVYKIGDAVGFYDPATLSLLSESTVTSFSAAGGQMDVGLSPYPGSVIQNALMANLTRRPSVRIDGVRCGDNRGRGFVIQTEDVEIVNCTIERCSGAGIHVRCDARDFYESSGSRDVLIANNLLDEVNNGFIIGSRRYIRAAIAIAADVAAQPGQPDIALGTAGSHRRVRVQSNTIRNTQRPAVHVGSAHTTFLTGNLFDQVCTAASPTGPIEMHYAVWIENSIGTTIRNNTLVGTPNGTLGFNAINSSGTLVEDNTGF